MAETTPQVSETFEAKPETKQFNLGTSFEAYAKTKGLSEKGIQMARAEIEERMGKYNKENMSNERFNRLLPTIKGMIETEISNALGRLLAKSEALAGTSVKPAATVQQVAYNVPEVKPANQSQTPTDLSINGAKKNLKIGDQRIKDTLRDAGA
ncbi:hypothetical protein K2X92_00805 [Candidatus Gracilibacteria bacterium]|nr:hypothetical protein [Candidatus Gracilibacteria bacterium]